MRINTLVFALASLPGLAFAQASFDAQLFKPTPHGDGLFTVESGAVLPSLDVRAQLYFDYANEPLELFRNGNRVLGLVDHRVEADVLGAITLFDRLSIGVAIPVSLYQYGKTVESDGQLERFRSAVFGDIALSPKVGILTQRQQGIELAVTAGVTLPSGNHSAFDGDRTVTVSPEVDISRRFGFAHVAVNLGYTWREATTIGDLTVGQELFYRVGVGFDIRHYKPNVPLEPIAEFYGRLSAPHPFANVAESPAEVDVGARYAFLEDRLTASLGVGRGVTTGYGATDFRVFGGVAWVFLQPKKPPPPPVAPPLPPPDPDRDHDGILNKDDKCPDVPGIKENAGCPDVDSDKDGIVDRLDKCPNEPGPKENGGCPDKDTDGDGIVDRLDKCPTEPETINGFQDEDGCPDEGPKTLIVMSKESIKILDSVKFETGKDEIKPESFGLLTQVANTIKNHEEIKKIRVEGHTDNVGRDAKNMDLSQRRANSVKAFLVAHGVAADRLEAVGYGRTRPVAPNTTAKGRSLNRRVAFTIVNEP